MHDVLAVMDAAGSERAVLFGYSEGGPMSILMAAMHPERVEALVLYGAYARRLRADDYPWARTPEERRAVRGAAGRRVELGGRHAGHVPVRGRGDGPWWGQRARAAATPSTVRSLIAMNSLIDVRSALAAVRVPTLVLHRRGDQDSRVEEGRYLAEHIPGARFVELSGADHFVAVNANQILDPVAEFLAARVDADLASCARRGPCRRQPRRCRAACPGAALRARPRATALVYDGPAAAIRDALSLLPDRQARPPDSDCRSRRCHGRDRPSTDRRRGGGAPRRAGDAGRASGVSVRSRPRGRVPPVIRALRRRCLPSGVADSASLG